MKPKIHLFTAQFPYGVGENFLLQEIEALKERFDVVIVPNHKEHKAVVIPPGTMVNEDFSDYFHNYVARLFEILFNPNFYLITFKFFKGPKYSLYFFKQLFGALILQNWILKNIPENEIIYSYWLNYRPLGFYLASKKKNYISISRAHGYDVYEERLSKYEYWINRKQVLASLNAIYCISRDGKKYLSKKYKLNNVYVAHLGIADSYGHETDFLQQNKVVLVSCSSFVPLKRIDLIYSSVKRFAQEIGQEVIWHHIGGGKEVDVFKNQFKTEKPVLLDVNFHGFIPNAEISETYRQLNPDFFINLSDFEGIPVSIMEAIRSGIPCIARNIGGMREIVNEHTGVLLSSNPNMDEIIEGMKELMVQAPGLRKSAKSYFLEHFNAHINYSTFVSHILHTNDLDQSEETRTGALSVEKKTLE